MATKKQKRAHADGAETAGNLQAAWPFPTKTPAAAEGYPGGEDQRETDHAEIEADERHNAQVDRIHVDQVDLYADPAKNVVQQVAIEQLVESPFNPRTRFDEQGLRDLAESMKGVGVMQAILVRPVTLPGEFTITKGGEPQQAYEIIFGHRRFRAAKLAGLATMPCIVRELTDGQAAQLQAIENVQRKDLDALDEARGYQHYIEVHGVSKDQLAAEIGLSRSHVYGRLKLLEGVPAVQEALAKGEIKAEVALYISRIPHEKLQEKALSAITSNNLDMEDGGKRSVRRIRDFLRERFMLHFEDAIFDTKDAKLIDGAGSCYTCSKRSGNSPVHEDITKDEKIVYGPDDFEIDPGEPDLCTDPECWEAKKKAHLAAEAAKLGAKGKTVITGGKARAAVGADGRVKGAYIALKDVKAELGKKAKSADIQTVLIQNPRDGKTQEAVAVEDLKAAGVKVKAQPASSSGGRHDWQAEQRRRDEKALVETKVNAGILAAVRQAAAGKPLEALTLHMIVGAALKGVDHRQRDLIALLHGCKSFGALEKQVGQMPADKLTTLMLDCALVQDVVQAGWSNGKPANLLTAAKHFAVDVDEIRKDVTKRAPDIKTADLLKVTESGSIDDEEAEEA